MLLEFKARNYKSFKDELCLSMIPDPDETALDYSVMTEHVAGETLQALCSTVVYGSNASGKTNVISALDTFRRVVLRGNIDNAENGPSGNLASFTLELIPNNAIELPQPVEFSIRFFTNGVLIDYAFSADLGEFSQTDYDRKVLSESLSVNEIPIFMRTDGVTTNADSLKQFPEFFKENILANLDAIRILPGWNVERQQLFLCNGFSSLLSPELHKLIAEWLSKQLKAFCRSDALSIVMSVMDIGNSLSKADEIINDAISHIGAHNRIGYIYNSREKRMRLASIIQRNSKNIAIPAEILESYGTYRFANLFPLLLIAFFTGSTLVLDEFDASLHPMVLMNIISLFHNPEINRNHAQLIFNTHNPIFLDRSLFRRDEIKFVERDEETQSSEIYALSDFEPERDCEDYLGNYFRDRYGAIQYVDLTPVFRKIMAPDSDEESGEA
ncbi:MAG: ATP-binding protein [Oscillibacter sp.]|nr:ATP-binding protein [Oscillibacter sp.]